MLSDRELKNFENVLGKMRPLNEAVNGGLFPIDPPLLSLEEYFGFPNATLWCNVWPAPENINEIDFWQRLRSKENVKDIQLWLIQIDAYGDSEAEMVRDIRNGEGEIYSDKGVFITSATVEEIESWFEGGTRPDELYIIDEIAKETAWVGQSIPEVPSGMHAVYFWYD